MTTSLLVLLVGDLLNPFATELRAALPEAFPAAVPEVLIGLEAPAGRTVAWVSLRPAEREVEVVFHTARVPGDLRRVLHFTSEDSIRDQAKAVAFTLAALVLQREVDLLALDPPAPVLPAASPRRLWLVDASLLAGIDVPGMNPGGGLSARVRHQLLGWLYAGVGFQLGVFSTPYAALVQPAWFADLALNFNSGRLAASVTLGGGLAAAVLVRDEVNITTWLPVLRVGLEGRLRLGDHHGFRFAVSGCFASSLLEVRVGAGQPHEIGPAWLQPEFGYFGEL